MADLEAVRSRARRPAGEISTHGSDVTVQLLDDRLRRLERRCTEDREARIRLEVSHHQLIRVVRA